MDYAIHVCTTFGMECEKGVVYIATRLILTMEAEGFPFVKNGEMILLLSMSGQWRMATEMTCPLTAQMLTATMRHRIADGQTALCKLTTEDQEDGARNPKTKHMQRRQLSPLFFFVGVGTG